ncbi:MAG: HD domain-containing protein [Mycoplasmoidaceae bacterium]
MEIQMEKLWNNFYNKLKNRGIISEEIDLIEKAWKFVNVKHKKQFRKSGDPYVIHLISTAEYLLDWKMDNESIVAGLLHDTLEDTDTTFEELKREFSYSIAIIVLNVTKASKLSAQTRKEISDEDSIKNDNYIINLLMYVSEDIRILTVKIADRLHNIKTIMHLNKEKQQRIAFETFHIFAPIADQIGLYSVKTELLDNSYSVIDPENYKIVNKKINDYLAKYKNIFEDFIIDLKKILEFNSVKCNINNRIKGIYSISKKLTDNKKIKDIKDIFAIRIITNSDELECYRILGIVHLNFKNSPNSFKDYISQPKGNLYQSLHTVLIKDGVFIEVQIRTEKMDDVANFGVASHWKYKQEDHKLKIKEVFYDAIEKSSSKTKGESIDVMDFKINKLIDVSVINNKETYSIPSSWTALDVAFRVSSEKFPYLVLVKIDNEKDLFSKKIKHNQSLLFEYDYHLKISPNWINYSNNVVTKEWIQNFLNKNKAEEDKISLLFYNDLEQFLGQKYIGNDNFKIRIADIGFNDINELMNYFSQNNHLITKSDIYDLASNVSKWWKAASQKIKSSKLNYALLSNLYFDVPEFILYKKISYPSCCTKAPFIDCICQLEKKILVIHNYKCPLISPDKQKYIIHWNKEKIKNRKRNFNLILQFIIDNEKINDMLSFILKYQLKIKKFKTIKVDNFYSRIDIHIACDLIESGQNILDDLVLYFRITKGIII